MTGDKLIMSRKELERKTLLDNHLCGKLTLFQASLAMRVSYRHSKRLLKGYKEHGDEGLQHKNRGKEPRNAYPEAFKNMVLDLYKEKYIEFGPTFAAEKMEEDDNIKVNVETLRRWLKEKGLWNKKRKRKSYRERRERRPFFGDLLQIDGSIHQWFSNDDNYYCLLNIVDDATGITLALMDKGETTAVLLKALKQWILKYGVPKAVYVDLKSVYVSPKKFIKNNSIFERVCSSLNIQIIRAYSPQAKGRVERKHAVFQDRFVKELKLYKIKKISDANIHLQKFLNKINAKFAKPMDAVLDAHRDWKPYGDLDEILCWQYQYQLKNDWTIRRRKEYFQVEKGYEKILKPGDFVTLRKYLDGSLKFWYGSISLKYTILNAKPFRPTIANEQPIERKYDSLGLSKRSRKNKNRTPWGTFNPNWLKSA